MARRHIASSRLGATAASDSRNYRCTRQTRQPQADFISHNKFSSYADLTCRVRRPTIPDNTRQFALVTLSDRSHLSGKAPDNTRQHPTGCAGYPERPALFVGWSRHSNPTHIFAKSSVKHEGAGLACPICRVAQRDKDVAEFLKPFSEFLVRAINNGRRLLGYEKAKDAMTGMTQRRRGFRVESLLMEMQASHESLYSTVHGQREHDTFEERLCDNSTTPVPDQAAFRIDWPAWLQTRTDRDRRIIGDLMAGERTFDVSRKYGLSPGRISQLRRELRDDLGRVLLDARRSDGGRVNENRGEVNVNARKKLNSAAIMGSLALASVAGCVADSWLVFILAALILLGLSIHSGDIRPDKGGW